MVSSFATAIDAILKSFLQFTFWVIIFQIMIQLLTLLKIFLRKMFQEFERTEKKCNKICDFLGDTVSTFRLIWRVKSLLWTIQRWPGIL